MNYYEEAGFRRGYLIVFHLLATFVLALAYWVTLLNHGQLAWWRLLIGLEWLMVWVIAASFWKYHVAVANGYLTFGFGLFRKRFSLSEIAEIDAVTITSPRFLNFGYYRMPKNHLSVYAAFNGTGLKIGLRNSRASFAFSTHSPSQLKEIIRSYKTKY